MATADGKNVVPGISAILGEDRDGRPAGTEGLSRRARVRAFLHGISPRPRILESSPIHETDEAVEYDAMVRRHFGLLNRPFVKMILAEGPEKACVLDIGTGPGWIPVELALQRPEWEIWGMDISADMVERARCHAVEAGVADRVHFSCGSATRLPFQNGDFDMVTSHFMLHHLDQPELLFNEMARVTRGGGRILIKDLVRQANWKAAFLLMFSKYVLRYSELQLQMYRESMTAALTFSELRRALKNSRLNMADVSSFRGLDFIVKA